MIKKILLENFQSHKKSVLDFDYGINIIVGSSNSGKTAILRGLYWVVENRPTGTGYISYWSDKSKVIVETDKGKVERYRDKKENKYILNDEVFEALGSKLPEQVKNFFDFNEINIQKQLDRPFLLSKSPGEVSRFFNKILKLEKIDILLKYVDSQKREYRSKLKYTKTEFDKYVDELKGLDWLNEFEIIVNEIDKIQEQIDEINNMISDLDYIIINYKTVLEELDKYEDFDIGLLEDVFLKFREVEKRIFDLSFLRQSFLSLQDFGFVDIFERKVLKMEAIRNELEKINIEQYKDLLFSYKLIDIDDIDKKIEEVKNKFPDVCPLCGQELKGVKL